MTWVELRKKEPADTDDQRLEFLNETDAQLRLQKKRRNTMNRGKT